MTTVAEFDWEDAVDRLLSAAEEVVTAVNGLTIAVLTIEGNDHRRARQLLREMVATLTDREFTTAVHKDWIREAQQLVGPLDDPGPIVDDGRIKADTTPLPVIQREDE